MGKLINVPRQEVGATVQNALELDGAREVSAKAENADGSQWTVRWVTER